MPPFLGRGQVNNNNFLLIKQRGPFVWGEKERQSVELMDDQSPIPEEPPRSKRGGGKGGVRRGATTRKAMEKGGAFWSLR